MYFDALFRYSISPLPKIHLHFVICSILFVFVEGLCDSKSIHSLLWESLPWHVNYPSPPLPSVLPAWLWSTSQPWRRGHTPHSPLLWLQAAPRPNPAPPIGPWIISPNWHSLCWVFPAHSLLKTLR